MFLFTNFYPIFKLNFIYQKNVIAPITYIRVGYAVNCIHFSASNRRFRAVPRSLEPDGNAMKRPRSRRDGRFRTDLLYIRWTYRGSGGQTPPAAGPGTDALTFIGPLR